MKKATLLLASALMISPAMFAQQQSATPADQSSSATQSTTSTQSATTQDQMQANSSKANLTADQKAELKTLRIKARTECKTDKTSDACKQAKSDLKAKMSEYGVQGKHHGHKKAAASTQSPS